MHRPSARIIVGSTHSQIGICHSSQVETNLWFAALSLLSLSSKLPSVYLKSKSMWSRLTFSCTSRCRWQKLRQIMAILWIHGLRSLKFLYLSIAPGHCSSMRQLLFVITLRTLISTNLVSAMANRDIKSVSKTVDGLYKDILDQACESKDESEVISMRQLVSMILFLRNPLPIKAISTLSGQYLPPLTSVIHLPTYEVAVTPFHASFPDFVTDPNCCSCKCDPPFSAPVALEAQEILALKCLDHMNRSLKYNICEYGGANAFQQSLLNFKPELVPVKWSHLCGLWRQQDRLACLWPCR